MTIDRSFFCFYHREGHIVALIDLCVWLVRLESLVVDW
jgi:hypothetical protein